MTRPVGQLIELPFELNRARAFIHNEGVAVVRRVYQGAIAIPADLAIQALVQTGRDLNDPTLKEIVDRGFIANRVTIMMSILEKPNNPLTAAFFDTNRELIEREVYCKILSSGNDVQVQKDLLRSLYRGASVEEKQEIMNWAAGQNLQFLTLLSDIGATFNEEVLESAIEEDHGQNVSRLMETHNIRLSPRGYLLALQSPWVMDYLGSHQEQQLTEVRDVIRQAQMALRAVYELSKVLFSIYQTLNLCYNIHRLFHRPSAKRLRVSGKDFPEYTLYRSSERCNREIGN